MTRGKASKSKMDILFQTDMDTVQININDPDMTCSVAVDVAQLSRWSEHLLVTELQSQPLQLAALIEGDQLVVTEFLPTELPWSIEGDTTAQANSGKVGACSCGEATCHHGAEAMTYARELWNTQPSLRLQMTGLTIDRLLQQILNTWSSAEPLNDADETISKYVAPQHEEQKHAVDGGFNIADWLAEMAQMGRLHLPGPQLHDIDMSLSEVTKERELAQELIPWRQLLPGVSSAMKGYNLVATRVIERAQSINSKQDSASTE